MRLSLDTETTGLQDDPTATAIELGVAGPPGIRFQSMIAPPRLTANHWRIIDQYNHIPIEELLVAPPAREVRRRFIRWYRSIGSPIVDGFCLPFDQEMLTRAMGTLPIRWGRDWQAIGVQHWNIQGRLSLAEARNRLDLPPIVGAHRALADAIATWEVGQHLNDPWWARIPIVLPGGEICPTPMAAAYRWAERVGCSPSDPDLVRAVRSRIPQHLIE